MTVESDLYDDTESKWMVTGENVTKPDDNRHHSHIGKKTMSDDFNRPERLTLSVMYEV